MSRQDAENLFFEQAKTAAREKAYVNRTPNQYALLEAQQRFALAKEAAKAKNKGKGKVSGIEREYEADWQELEIQGNKFYLFWNEIQS